MKTATKQKKPIQCNLHFEKNIIISSGINYQGFLNAIKTKNSYAFLLRNWIREGYMNCTDADEITQHIQASNLMNYFLCSYE